MAIKKIPHGGYRKLLEVHISSPNLISIRWSKVCLSMLFQQNLNAYASLLMGGQINYATKHEC